MRSLCLRRLYALDGFGGTAIVDYGVAAAVARICFLLREDSVVRYGRYQNITPTVAI